MQLTIEPQHAYVVGNKGGCGMNGRAKVFKQFMQIFALK